MKNSEILELTAEEINLKIKEEKANLIKLKFAHTISSIENPNRLVRIKKNIARLNTALTKRQLEASSSVINMQAAEN